MIRLRGEDGAVMAEAMAALLEYAIQEDHEGGTARGASVAPADFYFAPHTVKELLRDGLLIQGRDAEQAAAHLEAAVPGLVRSEQ